MHLVSLAKDAEKKFVFEVTILSMNIRLYLKNRMKINDKIIKLCLEWRIKVAVCLIVNN